MPAYNAEKYIEAAIRSVLRQTWTEFELLVIDDCSRDSTAEIAERLAAEDGRITLLRNAENAGVSASRNRGVREARGEWIAFLDSDDLWREDKLERQLELQRRAEADLIYSGAGCLDGDGRVLRREFKVPAQIDYASILRKNDLICSSVLLRRKLALSQPFVCGRDLHEDYICWVCLLAQGCRTAGVQAPLVWYRIRRDSKSHDKIQSAWMMWRSYQILNLPMHIRIHSFSTYALHGLRRYL